MLVAQRASKLTVQIYLGEKNRDVQCEILWFGQAKITDCFLLVEAALNEDFFPCKKFTKVCWRSSAQVWKWHLNLDLGPTIRGKQATSYFLYINSKIKRSISLSSKNIITPSHVIRAKASAMWEVPAEVLTLDPPTPGFFGKVYIINALVVWPA